LSNVFDVRLVRHLQKGVKKRGRGAEAGAKGTFPGAEKKKLVGHLAADRGLGGGGERVKSTGAEGDARFYCSRAEGMFVHKFGGKVWDCRKGFGWGGGSGDMGSEGGKGVRFKRGTPLVTPGSWNSLMPRYRRDLNVAMGSWPGISM